MRRAKAATLALLTAAVTCVQAQEAPTTAGNPVPPEVAAQLDELRRAISVRDQVIRNLIGRIEQLERAMSGSGSPQAAVAAAPAAQTTDAQRISSSDAAGTTGAGSAVDEQAEQDQQLIRAAFERTLIDRGGLLMRPGTFEVEPSVSYAHSSSENLVIDGFTIFPVLIVGDVFSERRRRNTVTTTLTGRLGLPWNSQLEVRVPYVYEDDSRLTGDGNEIRISDHGLGDIEVALSHELPRWFRAGPSFLGSLRWKSTTARDPFGYDPEKEIPFGSGFQTLSASLTGVSVLDPVVFFGTLTYTEALSARKGEDLIDPGDSLSLQLGVALALNLETSMSFAFEQAFTGRTRLNGAEVPGTYVNTGTLSVGLSRAFPSGRSFNASLAIGLSEDSPDVQLGFSMPMRPGRD